MGAWGVGIFEDDTNLDWIEDDYTSGGVESVRAALTTAAEYPDGDYLEQDDGTVARVAAEIVATCFDAPRPGMTGDHRETLLEHADDIQLDPSLIALAIKALRRVASENSELQELWEDGNPDVWEAEIDNLESRLGGLND